jgi:hypothetical protein
VVRRAPAEEGVSSLSERMSPSTRERVP